MSKFAARAAAFALCSAAFLISVVPAAAGTITLKSTRFSVAKPVPHFHHEGEVVVDDLERIAAALDRYVDCGALALTWRLIREDYLTNGRVGQ